MGGGGEGEDHGGGCQVVDCMALRKCGRSKEDLIDLARARWRVAIGTFGDDVLFGGGKVAYSQASRVVARSRAALAHTIVRTRPDLVGSARTCDYFSASSARCQIPPATPIVSRELCPLSAIARPSPSPREVGEKAATLVARCDIKKGELRLAPFSKVAVEKLSTGDDLQIQTLNSNGCICVVTAPSGFEHGGVKYATVLKGKRENIGEDKSAPCPFWFVTVLPKGAHNCEVEMYEVKVDGHTLHVPTIVNVNNISEGDVISTFSVSAPQRRDDGDTNGNADGKGGKGDKGGKGGTGGKGGKAVGRGNAVAGQAPRKRKRG